MGFDTEVWVGFFTELKLLPPAPEEVGLRLRGL